MHIDAVLARFAMLAGLTQEQAETWRPLCEDALIRIQSQCKENVDPAEQSNALCAAVSALAFYQYTLCNAAEDCDDFTAGEIKITANSDSVQNAERLWLDAKEQIAHLLKNPAFYFGTTRGWRCHEAQ